MRLEDILQMVETCNRKIDRTAFLIARSVIWDLEANGEVRKRAEQLGHEIVKRMEFSDVEDACEYLQEIRCGEVQVGVQEDEADELVADMGYDNVVVYDCISCCGAPEMGETLCAPGERPDPGDDRRHRRPGVLRDRVRMLGAR
ncbi:metabolic regulator [Methanopyrus kandleri]|uniref:Predicted metabolic regulator containing V4R domain n=2 Tax=Methanopyrus kandleri TaxID=2320 RepID=Q8TWF7_METKA|nr:metabolic regulator [Methanopyrus kandleri]AAM02291.1 Predicted metabolic regulator containing V4R domain [Methanopyrus kandleri AV19]HII69710.1 hypothetical protein [Methanopyrus kandleri]